MGAAAPVPLFRRVRRPSGPISPSSLRLPEARLWASFLVLLVRRQTIPGAECLAQYSALRLPGMPKDGCLGQPPGWMHRLVMTSTWPGLQCSWQYSA